MYVVSQRKISYLSDKLLSFRDCFYLVFTTGKFFSAKVPDALFQLAALHRCIFYILMPLQLA